MNQALGKLNSMTTEISKYVRETENPASKGVFRTVLNCSTYAIKANVGWLVMLTLYL